MCTPTFAMVRAIWTPSSPTVAKMNDEVSLLTNISELKFDHRFGFFFYRQVCLHTFLMLRAMFSPFKPKYTVTAQQSFNFVQFLRIEI